MPNEGVAKAAAAIRKRSEHEANRNKGLRLAQVRSVQPLRAKLHASRLVLGESDLIMGQWVKQYDSDYGIKRGDNLMVRRTLNGDWLVTDVVSKKTEVATRSGDANRVMVFAAASTVTLNHDLGKRPSVSVVDNAGTEWEVEKQHLSNNAVELRFDSPIPPGAFSAYFN